VGPEDERLEGIYERIEELDPTTFEVGGVGGWGLGVAGGNCDGWGVVEVGGSKGC